MKPDNKNDKRSTTTREYADEMRKSGPAPAPEAATTALVPRDVSPEELGLDVFDADASGDLIHFTSETRARLAREGFQQVEKYLSLKPIVGADGKVFPVGVKAWVLGWSHTLIPDLADPTKLRCTRKLHLELVTTGMRVSMLEAAQLKEVFRCPIDGSIQVEIYRGGMTTLADSRQMGQYESYVLPTGRKATHEPGKSYAQVAGEAAFRFQLESMTFAQLARVEGAPAGLLEPYIEAAKKREFAATAAATATAKA